eukprot:NODE_779_length_4292_cov_0.220606.p3 type:complete len:196 gc:universal NODE_779_length_4292_cov_0.220606:1886-1299(-)
MLYSVIFAAYFYMENNKKTCFLEDVLPNTDIHGHYKTELSTGGLFVENSSVKLRVSITEMPSQHVVKEMTVSYKGKWTYTTASANPHHICISFPPGYEFSKTRVHFDITIGEDFDTITNVAESLGDRIKDIDRLVQNALREARFQRTREAEFRDQTEKTHGKISNWTFVQLFVLGLTCVWQMRTLKNFFTAKKLV